MKSLILGGVKSGKSRHAQKLAIQSALPVTLIATALAQDAEMSERIARHKADRPTDWLVVEEPYALGCAIESASKMSGCVLVDCLTLWLTQLIVCENSKKLEREKQALLTSIETAQSELIIVSNENSMGIVPLGELSRRYCDEAGLLHQQIAQLCDTVVLSVAGLPMTLKGEL